MNLITLRSKLVATCIVVMCAQVFLPVTLGAANGSMSANDFLNHSACEAPECKQFDLWVGDWDSFDNGSTLVVARLKQQMLCPRV